MPKNNACQIIQNKTGARQYTRVALSIFAEIHSTHPIFAYISLLSPTLGLPARLNDALFGVHITGISGWKTHEYDCDLITGFRFAFVFICTFTECVT